MKKIKLSFPAGSLVLGPLLAAIISEHKVAIKQAQRGELDAVDMLELTCTLAHSGAVRVDPSITVGQIQQIVDMENFGQVFSACWGVSVPAGDPASGEVLQAGSPST